MKVLLIKPSAPDSAPFSTNEKRAPMGMAYLIGVLRDAGHEVKFIDMYIGECCSGEVIERFAPDFVGMYTDTITFGNALYSLKALHKIRDELPKKYKIIVGGPHATLRPQDIPDYVDHIVIGEGENAMLGIVEGAIDERILVKEPYIEDLGNLPMPDYDEMFKHNYDWKCPEIGANKVAIMSTSRGCPWKCKFCSAYKLWGNQYRFMGADNIIDQLLYLKLKHNIDGVYFREDNFIADKERTKKFCKLVKHLDITWKCEARVNSLDEDTIKMLSDAGCKALYIGVESMSQKVLNLMRKGIKVEDTIKVFANCKEYGIKAYASIIVGFPGETKDDEKLTHNYLNLINPYQVWFNVFSGLPGSDSYDEMTDYYEGEYGMRYPLNWDSLADIYYGKGIPWRARDQNYKLVRK